MTLPELAIRRPVTTFVTLVSIFVIGCIALSRLPLAFMPDVQERNLFVIVDYPSASPKAVERLVVRPLEEALGSLNGLEHMWSNCDERGGRVNLSFNWEMDMGLARTRIREVIDRVRDQLPDQVERIQISESWNPRETGDTIMEGRISSGRDLSADYDLLERKIVKPLERVPGVAQVLLDGVNPKEVRINLQLNALKRHNLDPRTILNTIYSNNADRSLGVVRDGDSRLSLRVLGAFREVDQIREMPIPGTVLKLKDVAEVTYKEPPLEYGRHLDGKFAIGVSVTQESSANTVTVSDAVKERVAQIATDPALEGISFLVWQDQGREIKKTIFDLRDTGILGAILASIVLFLFLRRMSSTIIAVACIPFSLIVACGVVWAMGKNLNTLTLLGLIVGVGMLVDNAVVIMENIYRYQEKGVGRKIAALVGAREVSVAVIAATLTSVIVFLPMIFSEASEMNIYLRELGLTICFTLLASLFVSQTLIPLAAGRFIKPKENAKTGPIMTGLQNRYDGILRFTLAHRWLAPTVGILIFASSYYPFSKLDINFDTNNSEMFAGIRYVFSENLSIQEKEKYVNIVEKVMDEHKEELNVDSIYSYYSDRFTTTRLYMKEGHTTEQALNAVRRKLPSLLPPIAGLELQVQDSAPFWRRNAGKRVAFQLQGVDTEQLTELADEAKELAESIPGLFDFYTDSEEVKLEVHAEVNRERAREYGINVNQPAEVVALTYRGQRLPRYKDPTGEVEMRLTLDEQESESVDQLRNLQLLREGGDAVPLDSLVDIALVEGPSSIRRNDKVTGVWVGARYEEGRKEEFQALLRERFEQMELPYGYRWDFQTVFQEQQESQADFLINLLLALGLIFAVMAGLFESIRQALSLMVSLPFAVVGALWALYLSGTDFDQPASVGLLLLLGIVVNNGIVMMEHINQYRRAGMPRREAMLRGGKERLRPILMTALTTLMGLVPMAIQQPALGGIYYYSMAYVIMGGLLVSTLLTLLLLPTTVCVTEDFIGWTGRIISRFFGLLLSPFRRRGEVEAN